MIEIVRRVGASLLLLLILVAPLAIGGTRAEVQVLLSAASLLLLILLLLGRLKRGLRIPWPLLFPASLLLLGLLQLLPLPPSLLGLLSPEAAQIRGFALSDLGDLGYWPISLDPSSSWIALFQQFSFLAVALAVINLEKRSRPLLLWGLALGITLIALIGFLHWGLELDKIYGFYQAQDSPRLQGYFSTFVNNNTLASLLILGCLLSLGLLSEVESELGKRLALSATFFCGAGAVMSGSRGGHLALLLALLLFFLMTHLRSRRVLESARIRSRMLSRVALSVAMLAVAAALYFLPEWRSLLNTPELDEKILTWLDTGQYIKAFWSTGSGRGSFALVFPRYQSLLLSGTVSHPENILLQWLCEWGVLGSLLALLGGLSVVWFLIRRMGRSTQPVRWALLAALIAISFHQLMDFGLESMGLSLPVAASLGLLLSQYRTWGRLSGLLALSLSLSWGGLLIWAAPRALDEQVGRSIQQIQEASEGTLEAQAERAVRAHPADYLLPLVVADRLFEFKRPLPQILRWINRSLSNFPRGGRAHLLSGRVLFRAGRFQQAALEYRLAMEAEPWNESLFLREVAAHFGEISLLFSACPQSSRARRRLGNILLEMQRVQEARALAETLLLDPLSEEKDRQDPVFHRVRARACLEMKALSCLEEEAHWLIEQGDPGGYAFKALLTLQRGERERAQEALKEGARLGGADPDFQRVAARVYARLGALPAARRALDRLWQLSIADERSAAAALALRGNLESRYGTPEEALKAFREALALDPQPRYAQALALMALKLGHSAELRSKLQQLRDRWPQWTLDKRLQLLGTEP